MTRTRTNATRAPKTVSDTRSTRKAESAGPVKRTAKKRGELLSKPAGGAAEVTSFLAKLAAETRRECEQIAAWMREATGDPGTMYGSAIVGFGRSTIRYADGREVPWMKMGFSPRKQALTLYGVLTAAPELLERLGKHQTGKGCLYVKRLSDIDPATLREIVRRAAKA